MFRKLSMLLKAKQKNYEKTGSDKKDKWKPEVKNIDNLVTIGTWYGAWTIPDNILNKKSIVYLAGAGEDLSFDVGIATKFGCKVFIFDPTPRAKLHFDQLNQSVASGEKMPIGTKDTGFYNIKKGQLGLLNFLEIGLWDKKDKLKFYSPKNPEHVSHSIVNLQKQRSYFVAEVDRLSSIMKQLGHKHLDLLKIDIEGAEYKVLESIIADNIIIKVLCVEFDEGHTPLDDDYLGRIKGAVGDLLEYGYEIIHADDMHNYTFALTSWLHKH